LAGIAVLGGVLTTDFTDYADFVEKRRKKVVDGWKVVIIG